MKIDLYSEVSAAAPDPPPSSDGFGCPGQSCSKGWSASVARNVAGVENLRPLWNRWPHSLETDLGYYLHGLRNGARALAPWVVTVFLDGAPQAMLVGTVRREKVSTVVSFVRISGPDARVLEIAKNGRLGARSAAIDRVLVLELQKAIENGEVDLLCFPRLAFHSPLFLEVRRLPELREKARICHVFKYSSLNLIPANRRPVFLSGKNLREIRRKTRILQQAFPGRVRFHCFSGPAQVDAGLAAAAAVARTTWQHRLGGGFSRTTQTELRLRFCASQGWLRIYLLFIDESPCAFLLGQLYHGAFYCQYAGYDPKFVRFSVGSLLTQWALEGLSSDGVMRVDLGDGDQEHHRRLGGQLSREGTVHLYSRTWRGLWVNAFFAAANGVRWGGRKTMTGLHLDWALAAWRRLLLWRSRGDEPDSLIGNPANLNV